VSHVWDTVDHENRGAAKKPTCPFLPGPLATRLSEIFARADFFFCTWKNPPSRFCLWVTYHGPTVTTGTRQPCEGTRRLHMNPTASESLSLGRPFLAWGHIPGAFVSDGVLTGLQSPCVPGATAPVGGVAPSHPHSQLGFFERGSPQPGRLMHPDSQRGRDNAHSPKRVGSSDRDSPRPPTVWSATWLPDSVLGTCPPGIGPCCVVTLHIKPLGTTFKLRGDEAFG